MIKTKSNLEQLAQRKANLQLVERNALQSLKGGLSADPPPIEEF